MHEESQFRNGQPCYGGLIPNDGAAFMSALDQKHWAADSDLPPCIGRQNGCATAIPKQSWNSLSNYREKFRNFPRTHSRRGGPRATGNNQKLRERERRGAFNLPVSTEMPQIAVQGSQAATMKINGVARTIAQTDAAADQVEGTPLQGVTGTPND